MSFSNLSLLALLDSLISVVLLTCYYLFCQFDLLVKFRLLFFVFSSNTRYGKNLNTWRNSETAPIT